MTSIYEGPLMLQHELAQLNLLLQNEVTLKVYNTKRISTEQFTSSILRDEKMKKRQETEVTRAPNSQS